MPVFLQTAMVAAAVIAGSAQASVAPAVPRSRAHSIAPRVTQIEPVAPSAATAQVVPPVVEKVKPRAATPTTSVGELTLPQVYIPSAGG